MGLGKSSYPSSVLFHLAIRWNKCNFPPSHSETRPVKRFEKSSPEEWIDHFVGNGRYRYRPVKGSPTRSTHRALTKGIRKAGSLRHQSIEGRGLGMWIPKGSQGVESLLIGAKPKDVRCGLHTVGRRALIKFWQESLQATFKKA